MKYKNIVFIATSLDGYIAGKNGEIDWLDMVPNTENNDMGWFALMDEIDAIVMGRATFDIVDNYAGEWHYQKPVFVLSNSLKELPEKYDGKASLLSGTVDEILKTVHDQGYHKLYVDGGSVIQEFIKKDLIHELRITKIPIILGDGIPLFSALGNSLQFTHIKTEVFLNELVQSQYKRKPKN